MQERGTHPPFYRSRKGGKLVCRKNRSLFVGALIVLLGAILAALDRLLTSRGRFARALPGFDLMKQSSMLPRSLPPAVSLMPIIATNYCTTHQPQTTP